ncbi:MAG: acyl carrier protein [Solirubrobacterales bacterium]|nr:acyl carrier protein [Solirubrobacterales bacterium]
MTRGEAVDMVREHLAEELGIDAAQIAESSDLRDDLEADSLDLYTLLQEIEDRLGIKISDEKAAEIETVGQVVDMILAEQGGE